MTCEELSEKIWGLMAMAAQAREFIKKQGYAPPEVQGEKGLLCYTLLLLAHCALLNIHPKTIREVATILEDEKAQCTMNTIVATVMQKLNPILNLMDHAANMTQEAANSTRTVVDRMYRTTKDTRDELQKGLNVVKEDIQKTMEDIKDEATKLTKAEWVTTTLNSGGETTTYYQEVGMGHAVIC